MARISLIVNPQATGVSARKLRYAVSALGERHKVDLEATTGRGHAADLARHAVLDGTDAVVVLGGDGTLSETFSALALGDVPVGVIPGGGTNVLSRSLGIPEAIKPAVGHLDSTLALGARRIGLGRAVSSATGDHRWFGFVAGIGFDAAAVRLVERRRRLRRTFGDLLFVASAVQAFMHYDRRQPAITVRLPGAANLGPFYYLFVTNTTPYTYLGARPIELTPEAHVNQPLSVAGVREMTLGRTLGLLGAGLRGRGAILRRPEISVVNGLGVVDVELDRRLPIQLDGEDWGDASAIRFEWIPAALPFLV